jgi:hypothetical protein
LDTLVEKDTFLAKYLPRSEQANLMAEDASVWQLSDLFFTALAHLDLVLLVFGHVLGR